MSVRTASVSFSTVSKSPSSRAKASSRAGNIFRFTSSSVTRVSFALPRCASSGKSSGQRTGRSTVSPGLASMISSSMPAIA